MQERQLAKEPELNSRRTYTHRVLAEELCKEDYVWASRTPSTSCGRGRYDGTPTNGNREHLQPTRGGDDSGEVRRAANLDQITLCGA